MPEIFIQSPEDQAVLVRIQKLCDINPKIWKDLIDKGIFKNCVSYADFFKTLFDYYRSNKEAKELAAAARLAEQETKPRFRDEDTRKQLDQATIAEKLQKLRLDKAREQELWTKNLVARKELVHKQELEQLMMPTFVTIANILRHAVDKQPQLQEAVDNCMNELYYLGERLEQQAIGDSNKYVETMLNSQIYLEELINDFEVENG
jgi:hypothetical protein